MGETAPTAGGGAACLTTGTKVAAIVYPKYPPEEHPGCRRARENRERLRKGVRRVMEESHLERSAPRPSSRGGAIGSIALIRMVWRAAVCASAGALCVHATACGSDPTEPSARPGMVFFTAASQRRLLVVDAEALSRNETGFQPAAQTINVGAGPWDVALSADGRLIFVANRLDDNVQIISTASGAIIGSVTVGLSPVSLHLGAGGRYLYVASTTGRTVSVVDVGAFSNGGESAGRAALTVRNTIFLSSVGWLTGTSDGTRLVVTMPSDDAVAIIDTVDDSVLHVIPVGDAPQMIVIGPDDRTAYVPNFISETVTVIDVRTGSVTDEIPLAEGAHGAVGVAVSPDGRYLYVTRWSAGNELDRGTLEKIDLVSRKTVARIEVGPQPFDVEISPDGRLAVVSSFTGMVATVDLAAERSVLAEVGAGMMGGLAFAVASGN